jgi:hypothetical protein
VLHSSLSVASSINHEVWLPASGWNGRLLGTGNGGWAGRIQYQALADGLDKGFATANTDLGTAPTDDGAFSSADPVSWLDAKVISILRNYMQPKLHPEGIIPNDKLMMMHKAVLDACAGKGGGLPDDPFITVPTACTWKPETLLCQGKAQSHCLTRPQLDMANFYYRPWIIGSTGEQVFPGLPRGTELGWAKYMEAAHEWEPPHASVVRSILGAKMDFRASDWDRDVATYLTIQGALWGDRAPADLNAFRRQDAHSFWPERHQHVLRRRRVL